MSRRRRVHAIIDNGTNRVLPSHCLLPEDGTIGDAVRCFNIHHAKDLWNVQEVELLGIVSEKSLLKSLAPLSSKLQDMMEAYDFLVFRSARRGDGESIPAATESVSEQETQEDEDDEEKGNSDIETKEDESEEDEEGEPPTAGMRNNSTSNNKSLSHRGSSEVNKLQRRVSSELRDLQGHSTPPVAELQRKRKKTSHFDPQIGLAASKWCSDTPGTARTNDKRTRRTRTFFDPQMDIPASKWNSRNVLHNEHTDRPTKWAKMHEAEFTSTPLPSRAKTRLASKSRPTVAESTVP